MTTSDGLMVVRMLPAGAANQSASRSRRLRRQADEIAGGRPHGGSNRPFGYGDDKITV